MQHEQTGINMIVIDHHISKWDVIPKDTVPVFV
jgi:single-stranded DNA-specific DHH superfamily exonuclease